MFEAKNLIWVFLTIFPAGAAMAQSANPYAGEHVRSVKALSAEEMRDLLEGRGMGLAKAAELNRHPGPMHVLELAESLGLSETEKTAVGRVFAAMRADARALGQDIVAAEAELDHVFARGTADRATVGEITAKIAALQGRLRAVHLNAHLAIRPMLASETIARYDALRGYAGGPDGDGRTPGAHPHRH
jgi:Spy/CpxP family protein refolding chaperone